MAVGGASNTCIIVCLIRLVTEKQKKQHANVVSTPFGIHQTDVLQ